MPLFSLIVGVAHAGGIIEDAPSVSSILGNALSFVLLMAGAVAILSFVVSGILYVTASGDESRMRQAKSAMIFSVIGIAVCLSALLVVRTVVGVV